MAETGNENPDPTGPGRGPNTMSTWSRYPSAKIVRRQTSERRSGSAAARSHGARPAPVTTGRRGGRLRLPSPTRSCRHSDPQGGLGDLYGATDEARRAVAGSGADVRAPDGAAARRARPPERLELRLPRRRQPAARAIGVRRPRVASRGGPRAVRAVLGPP